MKIGILTHHYVCNYGAFLQAYCLLKTVSRLFPAEEVHVINYVNGKHKLINAAGLLRFNPKRDCIASWRQKVSLLFVFRRESKRYLQLTGQIFTPEGIKALGLDVIIVGSDEVWNYVDKRSFHPVKFGVGLQNAAGKPILVAYAPSVGLTTDFSHMPGNLVKGLQSFHALSARDENTRAMLHAAACENVTRVLDPVFLFPLPPADTERMKELTRKPYVLFYHFGGAINDELIDAVHKTSCRLIGAGEYHKGFDEISADITPFEMAALFIKARYVLTGTFHGVVLACVNGVPFSVLPNNPTRVLKVEALLRDLGLEDRLVNAKDFCAERELFRPLDYTKTRALVKQKRAQSLEYIQKALQKQFVKN